MDYAEADDDRRYAIEQQKEKEIKALQRDAHLTAGERLRRARSFLKRVDADAKGPFHVFLGGSPQKKGDAVVPASLSVFGSGLRQKPPASARPKSASGILAKSTSAPVKAIELLGGSPNQANVTGL